MSSDPGEARMIELGIGGAQVPLHSHLVFFWENEKELIDAAGFLLAGLRGGDTCVLLGSSPARSAVGAILERHGFDLRALEGEERLISLPDECSADARLGAITSALERASSRHPFTIRFMGFVSWKPEDWSSDYDLLSFESRLTAVAGQFPCVMVCMHDVRSVAGLLLRHGAVETHPHLAFGPVVKENPYYIPPDKFLEQARATATEIAGFRKLEHALRDAERRYRELLESVDAIVWRGDPVTFRFTFVSKQAEKILGYPAERWTAEPDFWAGHIHPEDRDWAIAFCRKATEENRDHDFEYRMIAADGHIVWFYDRIHLVADSGRTRELVGVMMDISAQKRIEAELRASEQRFHNAFAYASTGLAISDPDGRIMDVNRAYCDITGFSPEELYATDFYSITHPADVPENRRLAGQVLAGEIPGFVMEKRYVRKDGSIAWVRNSVSLARDVHFAPVHFISLSEDITQHKQVEDERRRLEQQLLQAQKLESIGRLAGGVAHDFNNLLTVILGHNVLLRDALPAGHEAMESVAEIESAARRAESLTRQLLAFSRRQVLLPRVLDLNDAVADTERLLRPLIGENVRLQTVLSGGLGKVRADPGQIQQVIMNLVLNARDALPEGGTVSIETENVVLDEDYARDHTGVVPGPHVMLAVEDNGIGMDNETLAHLFEPFFTTKEVGRGTGLGLSMVYGIVTQSGGHISVESEAGAGTTMKVYFPRLDKPEEPAAEPETALEPVRGTETILLVEDEDAVRRIVSTFLRRAGYTVLVARGGAEALALCEVYQGRIHLLVTDVVMPGMDGPTLAARAVAIRSELKILYISGYADQTLLHRGVLETGAAFVAKPFTAETMGAKVRAVLDSPRGEWSATK